MHLHNGNRGEGSKSMQSTQPTDDLKLARSTEATSDQLRELSMSGDPEVRLAVAANPKAGYFILYRLVPSKIESDFDDQMLALLAGFIRRFAMPGLTAFQGCCAADWTALPNTAFRSRRLSVCVVDQTYRAPAWPSWSTTRTPASSSRN